MTQDLGTAFRRFEDNKFDDMFYVVGNEQKKTMLFDSRDVDRLQRQRRLWDVVLFEKAPYTLMTTEVTPRRWIPTAEMLSLLRPDV